MLKMHALTAIKYINVIRINSGLRNDLQDNKAEIFFISLSIQVIVSELELFINT